VKLWQGKCQISPRIVHRYEIWILKRDKFTDFFSQYFNPVLTKDSSNPHKIFSSDERSFASHVSIAE